MPVDSLSSSRVSTESSETEAGAIPAKRFVPGRSAMASVSVPAAPQEGQVPNHCSAVAPQSAQT